jgi:hypothetical protein
MIDGDSTIDCNGDIVTLSPSVKYCLKSDSAFFVENGLIKVPSSLTM